MKNKREPSLGEIMTSIEDLAIITKKGFDNTASKKGFEDFKIEMREFKDEMYEFKDEVYEFKDEMLGFKKEVGVTLFNISSKLEGVDKRLSAIEKILGPLVQVSALLQDEVRNLTARVSRLEHQMGVK